MNQNNQNNQNNQSKQPIKTTSQLKICFLCNCGYSPELQLQLESDYCEECYDKMSNDHLDYLNDNDNVNNHHVFSKASNNNRMLNHKIDFKKSKKDGDYFHIIKAKANGDCLYESISLAFSKKISVQELRNLVANLQTYDTFMIYKSISLASEGNEYNIIQRAESLEDFRQLVRQCGQDKGANNCIWGDENALYHISNSLNVSFIIFNSKGCFMQQIDPNHGVSQKRYIMLQLNNLKEGYEHFNLLKFNDESLFTELSIHHALKILKSMTDTVNSRAEQKLVKNARHDKKLPSNIPSSISGRILRSHTKRFNIK